MNERIKELSEQAVRNKQMVAILMDEKVPELAP